MTARRAAAVLALALASVLGVATAMAAGKPAGGAQIFAANCAYCHGPQGAGDGPNAAKLSPKPPDLRASHLGTTEIAGIVRDGRHACPSWKSSLSEDEVQAVAAFTRKLQR